MLKKMRRWILLVSLIVGFSAFIWAENHIPYSFQRCVAQERSHQSANNSDKERFIIGRLIEPQIVCSIRLLDAHNGFFVAVFTFILSVATIGLFQATGEQSKANERTIREAVKSSGAMESVADSMQKNVASFKETLEINKQIATIQKSSVEKQFDIFEMQLRAYISAQIGSATYQDRTNDLRFQAGAALVNNGATPAHRVVHRTRAAILPVPLPPADEFELIFPKEGAGEDMIPAHAPPRDIYYRLPDFVDDTLVEDIKRGNGIGLYVWSVVNYVDAFGKPRETKFCHLLTWRPDGSVYGYYVSGRNTIK